MAVTLMLVPLLAMPVSLQTAPGAPKGCPSAEALRAKVAEVTDAATFEAQAETRIEVRMSEADPGLEARVHLWRGGARVGERTLSVPVRDCDELASAVALHVAIVADPRQGLPPVTTVPLHTEARVGAGVAGGLTPGLTARFGGGLALRRGRWSGELDLRYALPSDVAFGGGSVSVDQLALELAACAHLGRYQGCALGLGGLQRYEGSGFDAANHASRFAALGLGVRVGTRWSVSDTLRVVLRLDVLASLHDVTLRVDGESAWRNPPVSATAGVDVGHVF